MIAEKQFFFVRASLQELANLSRIAELELWVKTLSFNSAWFREWTDKSKLPEFKSPANRRKDRKFDKEEMEMMH
jgi:hypothetical protein